MKTALRFSAAVLSFAATIGLTSCQKDQVLEPQAPLSSRAETAARESGKKYTLVNYGNATLSYLADGRLKQVTRGNQAVLTDRTDYSYGFLTAKTVSYDGQSGPNKKSSEATYQLDVNSGRCFESEHKSYSYVSANVTVVDQKTWKYEYNALGKLTKKYNKYNGAERTEYSYNADGNLTKAVNYGVNGVAKDELMVVYAFALANETPKLDRNYLNPVAAGIPDEFLPIFGKSSKYLIRHLNSHPLPNGAVTWGKSFQYQLNGDGFVTQRREDNTQQFAPPVFVNFSYLISL